VQGSRLGPWCQRAAGAVFIGLGLRLAVSSR
jgi:threonine/homoserine/homoserine lactone efflux protein